VASALLTLRKAVADIGEICGLAHAKHGLRCWNVPDAGGRCSVCQGTGIASGLDCARYWQSEPQGGSIWPPPNKGPLILGGVVHILPKSQLSAAAYRRRAMSESQCGPDARRKWCQFYLWPVCVGVPRSLSMWLVQVGLVLEITWLVLRSRDFAVRLLGLYWGVFGGDKKGSSHTDRLVLLCRSAAVLYRHLWIDRGCDNIAAAPSRTSEPGGRRDRHINLALRHASRSGCNQPFVLGDSDRSVCTAVTS